MGVTPKQGQSSPTPTPSSGQTGCCFLLRSSQEDQGTLEGVKACERLKLKCPGGKSVSAFDFPLGQQGVWGGSSS